MDIKAWEKSEGILFQYASLKRHVTILACFFLNPSSLYEDPPLRNFREQEHNQKDVTCCKKYCKNLTL